MSVLVDTSVWIRFLSNQAPFAAELDRFAGRRRGGRSRAHLRRVADGRSRWPAVVVAQLRTDDAEPSGASRRRRDVRQRAPTPRTRHRLDRRTPAGVGPGRRGSTLDDRRPPRRPRRRTGNRVPVQGRRDSLTRRQPQAMLLLPRAILDLMGPVDALYENGSLRPVAPLPLRPGE